jgi:hypothetical protein
MHHNFEWWMMYSPRSLDHASLRPVLACKKFRMYFNLWFQQQHETPATMPFPHNVHGIWAKITLGDPTWEKPLPAVYVRSQPREPSYEPPTGGAPSGGHSQGSGSGSSRGTKDQAPPSVESCQTKHINMHPNPILTKPNVPLIPRPWAVQEPLWTSQGSQ